MRKQDKIDALIHNRPEAADLYKKITEKQWTVYYYLLSVSIFNSRDSEDHRFVYKSSINISAVSKNLGVARSTFYAAIDKLEKVNLLKQYNDYYTLKIPGHYTEISRELLSQLLSFRKTLTVDLLRTYLFFTATFRLHRGKEFTKRNIIRCLGYPDNVSEYYKRIETYIDLLHYWNLIDYTSRVEQTELGTCRLYKVKNINTSSNILDNRIETDELGVENFGLTPEEEQLIKI